MVTFLVACCLPLPDYILQEIEPALQGFQEDLELVLGFHSIGFRLILRTMHR